MVQLKGVLINGWIFTTREGVIKSRSRRKQYVRDIGDRSMRDGRYLAHALLSDGSWQVLDHEDQFQESNMLSIQYRYFLPMGRIESSHFYIEHVYQMADASNIKAKQSIFRLCEDSSLKNQKAATSLIPTLRVHCMHSDIKNICKSMMSNLIKLIEIKCSTKIQYISCIFLFHSNSDGGLQAWIHHIDRLDYFSQSKQEDSSLFSADALRKSSASIVTDTTIGSLKKFHCKGDFCQYVEEQEVEYDDGQLGSIKVEVAKVRS